MAECMVLVRWEAQVLRLEVLVDGRNCINLEGRELDDGCPEPETPKSQNEES